MQTLKDDLSASQWPEADYEPDYEQSPTLHQIVTPEPEEQQVLNRNHARMLIFATQRNHALQSCVRIPSEIHHFA